MLILSQNRSCIVNLDCSDTILLKFGTVSAFNGKSEVDIGYYSSPKQAEEVIMDIFQCNSARYIMPDDKGKQDENS